jgi:hypothetical protein
MGNMKNAGLEDNISVGRSQYLGNLTDRLHKRIIEANQKEQVYPMSVRKRGHESRVLIFLYSIRERLIKWNKDIISRMMDINF